MGCEVPVGNFDDRSPEAILEHNPTFVSHCEPPRESLKYFANVLEYSNDHLEIPNVESGQCQSDVPKVTIALLQSFATSLAKPGLVRDTHSSVERSICGNCSLFLEVV